MTPKDKAEELFNKYYQTIDIYNYENVKNAALIAVDEILGFLSYQSHIRYWQEVKKEIEKL